MNAVVTNPHHSCTGVTLIIRDGKSFWEMDFSKTPPFRFLNNEDSEKRTLDPQNSLDDLIIVLTLVYEFTGTLFTREGLTRNLEIQSEKEFTNWDILNYIYDTPIEREIVLAVTDSNLGMGCGGLNIHPSCKTYGDAIGSIYGGEVFIENGREYFEYPDSVHLTLYSWNEIPENVRKENHMSIKPKWLSDKPYIYAHWYR